MVAFRSTAPGANPTGRTTLGNRLNLLCLFESSTGKTCGCSSGVCLSRLVLSSGDQCRPRTTLYKCCKDHNHIASFGFHKERCRWCLRTHQTGTAPRLQGCPCINQRATCTIRSHTHHQQGNIRILRHTHQAHSPSQNTEACMVLVGNARHFRTPGQRWDMLRIDRRTHQDRTPSQNTSERTGTDLPRCMSLLRMNHRTRRTHPSRRSSQRSQARMRPASRLLHRTAHSSLPPHRSRREHQRSSRLQNDPSERIRPEA